MCHGKAISEEGGNSTNGINEGVLWPSAGRVVDPLMFTRHTRWLRLF